MALARSRTANVVWGGSVALAITGVQFVQGIVLVPLYLAHVGVDRYGLWLATGNVLLLLSFVDPGVGDIIRVKLARALGAKDAEGASELVGTGLVMAALVAAVMLVLSAIAVVVLPLLFHVDAELRRALAVCAVGTVIVVASYVPGNMLEAAQCQREASLVLLATLVLGVAATFLGLTRWGWGLLALGMAPVVRGVGALVVVVPLLWSVLRASGVRRLRFSRRQLRDMSSFGVLNALARIGYGVVQQADAFLITLLIDARAAIVYSLTAKARDLLQTLSARATNASIPAIAHKLGSVAHSREEHATTVRAVVGMMTISIAFGAAIMAAYAVTNQAFMRLWVGDGLYGGRALTVLLAVAGVAVVLREALHFGMAGFGLLRPIAAQRIVEAVVRTGLAVVLLRVFGLGGLAVATAVAAAALVPASVRRLGGASGAPRLVYWRVAGYTGLLAGVAAAAGWWLPALVGARLSPWEFLFWGCTVALGTLACNLVVSRQARGAVALVLLRIRR